MPSAGTTPAIAALAERTTRTCDSLRERFIASTGAEAVEAGLRRYWNGEAAVVQGDAPVDVLVAGGAGAF